MVPSIGLMIGLYILARYNEMHKNAGAGTRIILVIFAVVTVFCILDLIITGASVSSLLK